MMLVDAFSAAGLFALKSSQGYNKCVVSRALVSLNNVNSSKFKLIRFIITLIIVHKHVLHELYQTVA